MARALTTGGRVIGKIAIIFRTLLAGTSVLCTDQAKKMPIEVPSIEVRLP